MSKSAPQANTNVLKQVYELLENKNLPSINDERSKTASIFLNRIVCSIRVRIDVRVSFRF